MKPYQYQILRYYHDLATGEFVNLGIVVFEPESNYLQSKVVTRGQRISNFFLSNKGRLIISYARKISNAINNLGDELVNKIDFSKTRSIGLLTSKILPVDDSALQFSKPQNGISLDPDRALNELFDRLIAKYYLHESAQSKTDDDAWRFTYKKYFDQKNITHKLVDHEVQTSNDRIKFDLSWKNGIWHIFKPISFDLVDDESIKNKVYKWSGVTDELQTAEEHYKLYFLALLPERLDPKLTSFILKKLQSKGNTEIISENNVDFFTDRLKAEMEVHK